MFSFLSHRTFKRYSWLFFSRRQRHGIILFTGVCCADWLSSYLLPFISPSRPSLPVFLLSLPSLTAPFLPSSIVLCLLTFFYFIHLHFFCDLSTLLFLIFPSSPRYFTPRFHFSLSLFPPCRFSYSSPSPSLIFTLLLTFPSFFPSSVFSLLFISYFCFWSSFRISSFPSFLIPSVFFPFVCPFTSLLIGLCHFP